MAREVPRTSSSNSFGLGPPALEFLRQREKALHPSGALFQKPPLNAFAKNWAEEWNHGAKTKDLMWNTTASAIIFGSCHALVTGGRNWVFSHGIYIDDSDELQHVCVLCGPDGYEEADDSDLHFGYTTLIKDNEIEINAVLEHFVKEGPSNAMNVRANRSHIPGVAVSFSQMPEYKNWYALAIFVEAGMFNQSGWSILMNPEDWSTRLVKFRVPTRGWGNPKLVERAGEDPHGKLAIFAQGKNCEIAQRGDARLRRQITGEESLPSANSKESLPQDSQPTAVAMFGVGSQSFEASSCKALYEKAEHPNYDHEVLVAVQRFLEVRLPELDPTAKEECKGMFYKLQEEAKLRFAREQQRSAEIIVKELEPEVLAEVLWTSAVQARVLGGDREFCWLINYSIRSDQVALLAELMPFIKALNRYLAPARSGMRPALDWKMLEDNAWLLHRGGGFNMEHQGFFKKGVVFRVPGFWATTPSANIAQQFMERAYQGGHTPIRWVIKVDEKRRCCHLSFIGRSLIQDASGKPLEDEFLFTQFSCFEITNVSWVEGPTPWHPHVIELQALPDNLRAPADLPLAPWN